MKIAIKNFAKINLPNHFFMHNDSHNNIPVGGRKSFSAAEIIYIKADTNYSEIYLTDGNKIIVATTLKVLEHRFSENGFIRINKSYLINKQYVTDFSDSYLILSNSICCIFSRRKKGVFNMKCER